MIHEQRSMEHARQVARLWDWLPAFRTVAETQHLPTASRILNVSPSALSRAVRLLEDEIGQQLFDREGRSLVLNEKGARFLEAVRNAMRGVHSALEVVDNVQFDGRVRAAAEDIWFTLVVEPAWTELAKTHPALEPELVRAGPMTHAAMLRRGDIDVAISDTASVDSVDAAQVTLDVVAEFPVGLFVRPGHSLLKKTKVSWRDVEATEYVAAAHYGDAAWPSHRVAPRFVVGTAHAAADLCRKRGAVTALPAVFGDALRLERVPVRTAGVVPFASCTDRPWRSRGEPKHSSPRSSSK